MKRRTFIAAAAAGAAGIVPSTAEGRERAKSVPATFDDIRKNPDRIVVTAESIRLLEKERRTAASVPCPAPAPVVGGRVDPTTGAPAGEKVTPQYGANAEQSAQVQEAMARARKAQEEQLRAMGINPSGGPKPDANALVQQLMQRAAGQAQAAQARSDCGQAQADAKNRSPETLIDRTGNRGGLTVAADVVQNKDPVHRKDAVEVDMTIDVPGGRDFPITKIYVVDGQNPNLPQDIRARMADVKTFATVTADKRDAEIEAVRKSLGR